MSSFLNLKKHDRNGYQRGCRCEVCVEGNRAHARAWRRKNVDRAREYETSYQYALYRLRDNHREEFLSLLEEERKKTPIEKEAKGGR